MPELTYVAEDLLKSIRNGGMIPNTAATGSEDVDLLRHASEGIAGYIVASINQLREQYYYWRERRPTVVNQSDYRIPERALWNKLANVWQIQQDSQRIPLHVLPKEDLDDYGLVGTTGVPAGYIIDGNYLKFIPDQQTAISGEIEWAFFVRPGNIVKAAEYRRLVAPITANAITLDSAAPADWTIANTFDIHSKESGCDYKSISLTASLVSGVDITFDKNINGSVVGTHGVVAGDYVLLENTVAIPGVPPELFPQVARLAAMHWAESTGDLKKFEQHGKILKAFLDKTYDAMEVRVEERPIRIGVKNSFIGYQGRGYW